MVFNVSRLAGSTVGVEHELYCMDNMVFFGEFGEGVAGSVDLAYVDPPYNTGNTKRTGFTYNDNFRGVGGRHAVWLGFMRPRLEGLHASLKDTGVLVCSIDDSEMPYLKVELDRVFGEQNFVAAIVVDGGALKNNARLVSVTHEYILVYAKSLSKLLKSDRRWRVKRDGVDVLLGKVAGLRKQYGEDYGKINTVLGSWLKASDLSKRLKVFKYVDSKGVYTHSDLSSPNSKQHYDFPHPVTGLPVKRPSRGWAFNRDALQQLVDDGLVEFFADHNFQPLRKLYLEDKADQVVKSVWSEFPARSSTHLLQRMLGRRDSFNNPKNLDFMKHIVDVMCPPDGVVLDVFAGSGSTGHAVLELNRVEGCNRRFILCTTDENKIFSNVTVPRLERVLSGVWDDGTVMPACDAVVNVTVEG